MVRAAVPASRRHAAVVDPGVGTSAPSDRDRDRRAATTSSVPTTACCCPARTASAASSAFNVIDNPQYRLPVVSSTFHGRDLFAPAAAHLALGVPLDAIGPPIDPKSWSRLDWPSVVVRAGSLETTSIYRDTFGNVKLAG